MLNCSSRSKRTEIESQWRRSLLWLLTLGGQTILIWLAVTIARSARAAEPMELDFTLASCVPAAKLVAVAIARPPAPDPLPPAARHAPLGSETTALPPAPTVPNRVPVDRATSSENSTLPAKDSLSFALSTIAADAPSASAAPNLPVVRAPSMPIDLFAGDSDSLVAKAVGSAEGTRTPQGGYTWAYRGHVDPGNGVWNLGSFSYQHGANSPQAADRKQIDRLRNQAHTLRTQADRYGLTLTLAETLNGIDLANQSPRAALSRGGYIDRLHQAHEMGLQGADAILWARTRAFLDPDTARWNAPGLGNNVHSITADQDRRRRAIDRAIAEFQHSP